MPIIHYRAAIKLLVVVRGHPFDRNGFEAMFLGMPGISATMVDQPAAAHLLNPEAMADYAALVLYDMPGLDFEAPEDPPAYVEPGPRLRDGLRRLLEQGVGVLALHHALAGWPAWPEYADYLGGRFLYHPGTLRGRSCLDSGYCHNVAYQARVAANHPITMGLPASFPLTDELYLAEVFEEQLTPLLTCDAVFEREHFYSAQLAVRGQLNSRVGWQHPAGSNLLGWTKRALNSPLVYLQPGDGPGAFESPYYRRLLENAIRWLVLEDGRRHL